MREIAKFDRELTPNKLMHAETKGDPKFDELVAECFDRRVKKMQGIQSKQTKKWTSATGCERNYVMNKKGYKHMLDDLDQAQ